MSNSRSIYRTRSNGQFPTEISDFRFAFPLTLQTALDFIATDNNKTRSPKKPHLLFVRETEILARTETSVSKFQPQKSV